MAKLDRETIVVEALDLLDDLGLAEVSTRRLAKRLGVEQPSLYWHFPNKNALLSAMAEAVMAVHATAPLPTPGDDWREWLLENSRSFRRALLMHRDGARLHAGSRPQGEDLSRALHKFQFLVSSGLSERDARLAMLTISQFTVGSVLEEQAATEAGNAADGGLDHAEAFEDGLTLIVDSLVSRADR
ncbi:TetR/AcrR family transcriptional regulator C-terminal domain-containing protein [Lentzea sp. NBC_00516]|uniref:TetR/AcrR family transcriptional regulator C-terminal domain-containing protein n=1 Tax=Lentzea sp. NBC_00516 TaxID=2903582 RepID=UPI002E80FE8A|nr:TetR/AcrR family transcriptional regulator C-terminal domain-containing protein [Lentzea sp. NBC_00516]WUD27412.1 TetR/AcrR family transcriptional regulator C-terminal domain-containing protein [Lentzea sp. NBC_00516]